jgi:hypothetical protein
VLGQEFGGPVMVAAFIMSGLFLVFPRSAAILRRISPLLA